ncbi:hypothetical protein O0L34_g1224 [Tuta absoluta]|nr:hypothetical protein O0L34_g1224 [Tuta absoluta]
MKGYITCALAWLQRAYGRAYSATGTSASDLRELRSHGCGVAATRVAAENAWVVLAWLGLSANNPYVASWLERRLCLPDRRPPDRLAARRAASTGPVLSDPAC